MTKDVTSVRKKIPEAGRDWTELREELTERKHGDFDWRGGRIPLYVYFGGEELHGVAKEAYNIYFSENALGKKAFPSVDEMEREVIGMCLDLFHAPLTADGSFTCGGTESNFLVLKMAREHARAEFPDIERPKAIVSSTCHPSIDKAGYYLGVDVVRVPATADFRADVDRFEKAIDDSTILLVASAPGYTHGVFDPIGELGHLAQERNRMLHIDACLGGFLAPFVRDIGYPIPDFDFAVAGVTSLSADIHKYGMSAKGASVLLYRDGGMKRFQRFETKNWPRGLYATDTFLGSRSAGAVASAWAVMNYLGREGYRKLARTVMDTKRRLTEGIESIDGLEIVHPSELCMLLYRSKDPAVDINAIGDNLLKKGWFVGRAVDPVSIHLAINPVHAASVDEYLSDLRASVDEARSSGAVGELDESTY